MLIAIKMYEFSNSVLQVKSNLIALKLENSKMLM